jgi:hypothetical protein
MVQTRVTKAAVPVAWNHKRKFHWLNELMDCIALRTHRQEAGAHNSLSLVELRRAAPWERLPGTP